MTHPYTNYLITRDNYLSDPESIIELSKIQTYNRASYYPGLRTDNLLASKDPVTKDFAHWFTNNLSYNVFPGISMYETYLCFHINEISKHKDYNYGWIHSDVGTLAGLVYLTPNESNLDTGTSIFKLTGSTDELPGDAAARAAFSFNDELTDDYIKGFKSNQSQFKETIRVGNQYNRLVAYDSQMYHRPNNYVTETNQPRLTLLFFISKFNYNQ
jgi:hypothetical protein